MITDITKNINSKVKNQQIVIEVRDLTKSFGEHVILDGVSFDLFEGENLVVLGKSGSGKSVLIKCIVGLLEADGGTIKVYDENVTELKGDALKNIRSKVGFLFQSGALYDSLSVKENMEFPLRKEKSSEKKGSIDGRIEDALSHVGLSGELDKMPSELSGGMVKRLSLARTLVINPLIMLYDEPTTGLDPVTGVEISLLINEIRKKYKTSSLIITHDIKCAKITADRIIMLRDGKIYAEGKPEFIMNYTDDFIQSFFN